MGTDCGDACPVILSGFRAYGMRRQLSSSLRRCWSLRGADVPCVGFRRCSCVFMPDKQSNCSRHYRLLPVNAQR